QEKIRAAVQGALDIAFTDKTPPTDLLKQYAAGLAVLVDRYLERYSLNDDALYHATQLAKRFKDWLPNAVFDPIVSSTTVPLRTFFNTPHRDDYLYSFIFPPVLHEPVEAQVLRAASHDPIATPSQLKEQAKYQFQRRIDEWKADQSNHFRAILDYPVPIEAMPQP